LPGPRPEERERPQRKALVGTLDFRGDETAILASLYAASGARKYLNRAERQRALAEIQQLPDAERLFALTLSWTGAR
jgi:hypothetical protein